MSKTGQPIDYFFGTYKKVCKQTNNDCQWCNCLYFHNNIKTGNINDCKNVNIKISGLTMRQISIIALFFRFFDYDNMLSHKHQLVDVINGIYSKEKKELNQKNIYSNPLLSTLFINDDNVIVSENDSMIKSISDIIYSNDYNLKYTQFNIVRKKVSLMFDEKSSVFFQFLNFINFVFADFFKDGHVFNNILETKEDKIQIIHILLNIYKMLIAFPDHIKINNGKDVIKAIKTKIQGNKLANKEVKYIDGDYDDERLSDFTSSDKVKVFIASLDSYYFIYKKYNISDKNLYLLFEIYDYLETIYNKKNQKEQINKLLGECLNILKSICKQTYELDIDNMIS